MNREETYYNLNDVINNIPENYKILEEIIDVDVQKEFFDSSQRLLFDHENDRIEQLIDIINNNNNELSEQKIALQKLAMIDNVEAFRAIEAYNQNPRPELKAWSVLSLQQSRMVIQSSLLDEQQVFISTGLGGKDNKLRYFVIFPYKTVDFISPIQQKTLKNELEFFVSQYEGTVEDFAVFDKYATTTILLPLRSSIPELVSEILHECNHIGDFLTDNVMITNMKKFEHDEIVTILKENERE